MYIGLQKKFMAAKESNPVLVEMELGILLFGFAFQLVGVFLVQDKNYYTGSLWFGILLALITVIHMHKNLVKALESERNARALITVSNLIRYICIIIIFAIISVTGIFNPLVTFVGLISLKAAAYLQPITHKLCSRIFRR